MYQTGTKGFRYGWGALCVIYSVFLLMAFVCSCLEQSLFHFQKQLENDKWYL